MTAEADTDAQDRLARLVAFLAARGGPVVEPPILYPLATFVDLAGEDFRRRLFTTTGFDGTELALRPDYTIAVALEHLAGAGAGDAGRYAYCGEVFRQRRQSGNAEFLQAGVEWIGAGSGAEGDTGILALALEVAERVGTGPLSLRVGDADLFSALVGRLGLAPATAQKLVRGFGDPDRVERLVETLKDPVADTRPSRTAGLAAAVGRLPPAEAQRVVAAVVEASSGTPFGGRSAGEIAERILSRGNGDGSADPAGAARILTDYLTIRCPLAEAPARLRRFSVEAGIDLVPEAERLEGFVGAIDAAGIDTATARFEADFGRRLDYYTGFVFEFLDPARPAAGPIVGGGRYDRLLQLLGAPAQTPAVGFAVWLDRLGYGPAARRARWSRP